MYIRLVVTYCKEGKLVPKEAHIDTEDTDHMYHTQVLNNCMEVLKKKLPEIQKMIPTHLKNKDFDIIIYGDYLKGLDYIPTNENCTVDQRWKYAVPIFNVKQLGLPEDSRPIIKTS